MMVCAAACGKKQENLPAEETIYSFVTESAEYSEASASQSPEAETIGQPDNSDASETTLEEEVLPTVSEAIPPQESSLPEQTQAPVLTQTPVPSTKPAETPVPVETCSPTPERTPGRTENPSPSPTPDTSEHAHIFRPFYWYGEPVCSSDNNYYTLTCEVCGEYGGDGYVSVPHTESVTEQKSKEGCTIYLITGKKCSVCGKELEKTVSPIGTEHTWVVGTEDPVWDEESQAFISRTVEYCSNCYQEK